MFILKINNTTKVNKNVLASQDVFRSQMKKKLVVELNLKCNPKENKLNIYMIPNEMSNHYF